MSKLQSLKPRLRVVDNRVTRIGPTDRERGRPGARARQRVLLRDGYLCQVCIADGRVTVAVEVDHIVPLHRGGVDTDHNKQSICATHHREKTLKEIRELNK